MQYSIAGGSGLFKVREYIKSPKDLKYDLSSRTDVPASGSMFAGCNPVPEATAEHLWLQSTNDLWREVFEHAGITTICAAAFFIIFNFFSDQLYWRTVYKQ